MTICKECKRMMWGEGVTEFDPVTGYGGEQRGLFCEDVNKGNCPDFVQVGRLRRWWMGG